MKYGVVLDDAIMGGLKCLKTKNFLVILKKYIKFFSTLGFVLQSREFIGAGLTPENILSRWLQNSNSEEVQFIQQ